MAGGRAADDRADGHDQPGHGGSGAHDRGARCRRGLAGPRDQVARALGAVEGGCVRAQGTRPGEDRPADRRPAPMLEPVLGRAGSPRTRWPGSLGGSRRLGMRSWPAGARSDGLPAEPDPADLPGAAGRQPDPAPRPEPERFMGSYKDRDGWLRGEFCLPPAEGAELETALGRGPGPGVPRAPGPRRRHRRLVHHDQRGHLGRRLHAPRREGADALDKTLQRTGHRGERCQVVLHHDVDPDGTLGPASSTSATSSPTPWPASSAATPTSASSPGRPDGCSGSTPPSAPSPAGSAA